MPSYPAGFWLVAAYLAFIFLTGGGAREDIQSLVVLRPIAVLASAWALLHLQKTDLSEYRTLLLLLLASMAVCIVHLIPLPPAAWQALPYRDLIERIDDAAGLGDVWRPLSIAPRRTLNALFALFVPLSVLLMAARLDGRQLRGLLGPIILIGLLSGLVGLLQLTSGSGSALYFYRIHNEGSAVGFFANRNHQAALLATLFPMLAVYAARPVRTLPEYRLHVIFASAAGLVLVSLLLVTGSRAGLLLGLVGLASIPFLHARPPIENEPRRRGDRPFPVVPVALGGAAVVLLMLIGILLSRADAYARLVAGDQLQDVRLTTFRPVFDMVWAYFPFGSGIGSFVEAYYRDEPRALLSPSYLNHAHNDLLEIAVTGGVLGLTLVGVVAAIWLSWTFRVWRRRSVGSYDVRVARMAAVVIGMLLAASLVDYPLRTPSLSALLIIAAIWLRNGLKPR